MSTEVHGWRGVAANGVGRGSPAGVTRRADVALVGVMASADAVRYALRANTPYSGHVLT
ncbi:hypothetical protein [Natronocella acetinitrilica]|uniref:hypothetical protein n=1 Tax=Natronocella acetinitrilica TaxID=414046 RepID=UPI00209D596D|nr:hypothetical protein [Natronocella acetinitrilica]